MASDEEREAALQLAEQKMVHELEEQFMHSFKNWLALAKKIEWKKLKVRWREYVCANIFPNSSNILIAKVCYTCMSVVCDSCVERAGH